MEEYQELLKPLRQLQHLRVSRSTHLHLLVPLLVDRDTTLAPIERLEFSEDDSVATWELLSGHPSCTQNRFHNFRRQWSNVPWYVHFY
jgi:hypothetical protein